MLEAAWRYVADGRRSPVAPAGDVAAVVDHVREGFGRWVARSGWAAAGSVACGVDSCPNLIVDPTRCAGLFVFTPGLDVVGICERCARVASGDVAAAPGCFGAVSSLYVFRSETDGHGERLVDDAEAQCHDCRVPEPVAGWAEEAPSFRLCWDCATARAESDNGVTE